jgi:hypothetical protein
LADLSSLFFKYKFPWSSQKDLATGLRIESELVAKWERNGEISFVWRGEMR